MAKCGSILDEYGLDPREYESVNENALILYNTVNFDNIWMSSLAIFQTMTLDGWTAHMYNY